MDPRETFARPLLLACRDGMMETVLWMLGRGAYVDSASDFDDHPNYYRLQTGLQIACQCQHRELALLLLDRGADVSIKDDHGWTALHYACEVGNVETALLLLDRGADVSIKEENGWTALHYACKYG